jgi:hypothetical protein
MSDTKIVIVLRDDLATWQKLNVTAFLTSGIVGATQGLIGEPYEDAAGNRYAPLAIQPMIVLAADGGTLKAIYDRAMARGCVCRSTSRTCSRPATTPTTVPPCAGMYRRR